MFIYIKSSENLCPIIYYILLYYQMIGRVLFRLEKEKRGANAPLSSLLLQAQVNILPSVMPCFTQLEAATLQLNYLKVILLCSNLCWSQFSKL